MSLIRFGEGENTGSCMRLAGKWCLSQAVLRLRTGSVHLDSPLQVRAAGTIEAEEIAMHRGRCQCTRFCFKTLTYVPVFLHFPILKAEVVTVDLEIASCFGFKDLPNQIFSRTEMVSTKI